MSTETERIAFLLNRDGRASTRRWIERTLSIYREAITNEKSHASLPHYRPLFEAAIDEYERWLGDDRKMR